MHHKIPCACGAITDWTDPTQGTFGVHSLTVCDDGADFIRAEDPSRSHDEPCIHPGVFAPSDAAIAAREAAPSGTFSAGHELCWSCNTLVPWTEL